MELVFYGVRGSYPTARRDQLRYGGNSTCLYFETRSGQCLILDAGSGIRHLGQDLLGGPFGEGHGVAYVLISHTHWDHILGFPFFAPLSVAGNRFVVVSAGQVGMHIREVLDGQQNAINFPISMEAFQAKIEYMLFNPGDTLVLGAFRIETVQLNHPGTTVGYRIEADGHVATVVTDTARIRETQLGDGMGGDRLDEDFAERYLADLVHLARESDVLVHDAHFLEHEIYGRYAWGHSTVEDAIEVARLAGAQQLWLFHHHPERSDTDIEEQLSLARDLCLGEQLQIEAAAEGVRLVIGSADLPSRGCEP
jgi:ribonuclease BN (tRNA processing enzyme)